METKSAKALPKTAGQIMNGGIYSQRVRCGKLNCRCSRGAFHTAFYFFMRRQGKLIKFYIRKSELIEFSSLVARATADRKEYRRVQNDNLKMLTNFRQQLHEIPRQITG